MDIKASDIAQLNNINPREAREWLAKFDEENAEFWRSQPLENWLIDEVWNYVRTWGVVDD